MRRLKESSVFHHVEELVRSTLSDWISRHSSLSSRILGEAKATGAIVEFGLDEREAAIEGMILIDLRTEVGSKKTAPDAVSFAARTDLNSSYRVYRSYCSVPQCL